MTRSGAATRGMRRFVAATVLVVAAAAHASADDPARVRLAEARALQAEGKDEAALDALRAAVFLHRGDIEISRAYQNAMVRAGRKAEVVKEYRALADAFPQEVTWRYLHGRLLEGPALEKELQEALRLAPNFFWARFGLGRYYLDHRRCADAIPHLRRACELQPGRIETHGALAQAHHLAGEFESAESVWQDAVKRFPESPGPRVGLGVLYKTVGRGDPAMLPRAIEQLDRVVKAWPKTWEAYEPLIQACYATGDAAKAGRIRDAARALGRELGKDEMIVDAVDAGTRVLIVFESLRPGDLWLRVAAAPKGRERVEPVPAAYAIRREGGAVDLHRADAAKPRQPGPFLARFAAMPSHADLVAKLKATLK